MDLDETMARRYSARRYDGRTVPRDILMRIADAGNRAPTARNQQRERFVFVDDRELIVEMVPLCIGQSWIADAGALVFVCGYDDYDMPNGFSARAIDDAIAACYMMLEATSLGLGTCWLGGYDSDAVKRRLGIPEDVVVSSALAIGYAAEGEPKPVRPVKDVVGFNGWGQRRPTSGRAP